MEWFKLRTPTEPKLKRPLVVFLDLLAGICSAVIPCMSMFVASFFEIHVSLRKIKSYSDKLLKNHNLQFSV